MTAFTAGANKTRPSCPDIKLSCGGPNPLRGYWRGVFFCSRDVLSHVSTKNTPPPYAATPGAGASPRNAPDEASHIRADVKNVAILRDITLALELEFAGFFYRRLAAQRKQIRARHLFGADEVFSEIRVNFAGAFLCG